MTDAPSVSVDDALRRAAGLLEARPRLAEHQARAILAALPSEPRALTLLASAVRRQGDAGAAKAILEPLAARQPRAPTVHLELALSLVRLGESEPAAAALERSLVLKPDQAAAWRALGDILILLGCETEANHAYAEAIRWSVNDPVLVEAALALRDDKLAVAERLLRERLKAAPTDVAAIRMLAETGTRLGRYADAEALLSRCLDLAPDFAGARHNLAIVLYRQQKAAEAIPHVRRLLGDEPDDPGHRNLLAACLGLVGAYDEAISTYENVLAAHPDQPKIWLSFGHALRTAGRRDDAIAAYRRSLEMAPTLGETWWSLANLKTRRFEDAEIDTMRQALDDARATVEDRFHVHYALGKALEDLGQYDESFGHYAAGARLRRGEVHYDPEETSAARRRAETLFTPSFFASRSGGCPDPAPIFIVGLPRSGSTLLEQILASHSAVEGTIELPDIGRIARELGLSAGKNGPGYPARLADLSPGEREALGREYIDRTRIHRKLGRPRFIDKMPNNFQHIGLIKLILPHARIIDARRHPMAAGFSAFKQHFARGQTFSYDLDDIGCYYADYVRLMRHFDATIPGAVHRVVHEDVVADTEGEVRRLLDHCDLPFEADCLRFHENDRPVRTASSEQVRRPIFRDGLDQWRNFAPWLDPLERALGDTIRDWR